ncbi:MAG: M48 family metallopeptidase [Cyanobacteriota bacterium]
MTPPPAPGPCDPGPEAGRGRRVALALLLAMGTGLLVALSRGRPADSLAPSLALPFQLLGTPVHLVDRLASRVVPVDSLDERVLGDSLRQRYEARVNPADPDQRYLDRLLPALRRHTRRPFPYRAYLLGRCGGANAMALPGGVILVCKELLEVLGSESELVAVLAHEIGHIELSHTFDVVRFQLLARRTGEEPLGSLADAALHVLLQNTYSKAAEHEADDYAFALLLASRYDPAGLARGFASLNRASGEMSAAGDRGRARFDPLGDFSRTHPPDLMRQEEYGQRAEAWWRQRPRLRRYVGRANFRQRQPLAAQELPEEWSHGGRPAAASGGVANMPH